MFFYLLIALVVGIDQWVKYYVRTHFDIGESVPLWDGILNMTSHRNQGAAFGILEGQIWFFLLSTVLVVVGVLYFRAKGELKGHPLMEVGAALLLGGALGNAVDRVWFGEVTDFFDVQFMNYAIFNVADVAINVAIGCMALSLFLDWRKTRKQKSAE